MNKRGNKVIGAATLAVNLGNFLFLVMVARDTSPVLFGATAAVLGLLLLFEVPANALQAAVARDVEAHRSAAEAPIGRLVSDTIAWGMLGSLVVCLASPGVRAFLHLPSLTTALLIGLDVIPIAIGVVPRGVLLGEQRYGMLFGSLVAGTAVKLVLGTLFVHNGQGVQGAVSAVVAGELVTSILLLVPLRRRSQLSDPNAQDDSPRWRQAKNAAIAFTGYWLLTSLDVILARHYFPGSASGDYAVAATGAQAVLIVPAAVAAFAFPRFVSRDPKRARLLLLGGIGGVGLLGLIAAAVMWLAPGPIVRLAFGTTFAPAIGIIGLLTAAGAIYGVVAILLHFHVARNIKTPSSLCWLGIVILVAGTAVWHHDIHQIAAIVFVSYVVVAGAMIVVAIGQVRVPDDVMDEARRTLLDADLDLTIVVPYYNPGDLLLSNMQRLLDVLHRSDSTFEVIAVSDGSTDGSERLLDRIDDDHLIRVVLPQNMGKGAALRIGMARGRGRWLGFLDADGDLDPSLLEPFQALVRLYDPEVILGSKRHPLSEIEYPPLRQIYSVGYQQLTRLLFSLNIRDTQTGIKIIRRDVLSAVLPRMVEKRFAFDLELFVIARRLGYKRFLEAPVHLHHQFVSTVSWKSVVRTMRDTMAIFYRLRIVRWYDEVDHPTATSVRVQVDPLVLRGTTRASRPAPPTQHHAAAR